jgi:hypothetical protein
LEADIGTKNATVGFWPHSAFGGSGSGYKVRHITTGSESCLGDEALDTSNQVT